MGYYFPFPYVQDTQKSGIADQLTRLNSILRNEAELAGAHFVNVSTSFGENAINYLPNPSDIHPNMEGYRSMANSFLDQMSGGSLQVTTFEMPAPAPKSFEELRRQLDNPQGTKSTVQSILPPHLVVAVKELHQT